jgi:hypothetical protein
MMSVGFDLEDMHTDVHGLQGSLAALHCIGTDTTMFSRPIAGALKVAEALDMNMMEYVAVKVRAWPASYHSPLRLSTGRFGLRHHRSQNARVHSPNGSMQVMQRPFLQFCGVARRHSDTHTRMHSRSRL